MRRRLRIVFTMLTISLLVFERCAYNDINVDFDCTQSTLAIEVESTSNVSNCRAIDGVISVVASGGLEPYNYNIDGGEYQTNSTFSNLQAGTHNVRVKDKNGCWKGIDVTIAAAGSTLAATVQTTADNQCSTDNGVATITATGGVPPYQFQIDSKGYSDASIFSDLKEGQHVVIVKDAEECQTTLSVLIAHGNTGISYANDIKPIITTNCATTGCHGAGTGSRDWTDFTKLKANASDVKTRTANHTMPPETPLSQSEIDLIGCWVDDGALNN